MKRSSGFYNWAWDTVVGCKNGCWYCYAKHIVEKNHRRKFEDVMYYNDLWNEPAKVPPSVIFVNHFADIMGDWVPKEWIQKVIDTAWKFNEHNFLFMTKNPARYKEFAFPANCILGVTIESPAEWWRADIMKDIEGRQIASVEPILGDFTGYYFSQFEYVVIGALLRFDGTKFTHEFYDTVKHGMKYYTR
jgi:protein gp37